MAKDLPKGLRNNNGIIQIRINYKGISLSMSGLGKITDKNSIHNAIILLDKIRQDISLNRFIATNNQELQAIYNPSVELANQVIAKSLAKSTPKISIVEIWDKYVEFLCLPAYTQNVHYKDIRSMLIRCNGKIDEQLSTSTYNLRLSYLNKCMKWAMDKNLLSLNPFEQIKKKKRSISDIERANLRKPFTVKEIELILLELKDTRYYNFILFWIYSGLRNSELIGLRVSDCDFSKNIITISTSLSRDRVNGGRTRKQTKTGNSRILPMNEILRNLLLIQCKEKAANDLVFTSSSGKPINDKNFTNRIWKPLLDKLDIPYRVLYALRHTFASYALLENQGDYHAVAAMMGHSNPQMLINVYGHSTKSALLPNFTISCSDQDKSDILE